MQSCAKAAFWKRRKVDMRKHVNMWISSRGLPRVCNDMNTGGILLTNENKAAMCPNDLHLHMREIHSHLHSLPFVTLQNTIFLPKRIYLFGFISQDIIRYVFQYIIYSINIDRWLNTVILKENVMPPKYVNSEKRVWQINKITTFYYGSVFLRALVYLESIYQSKLRKYYFAIFAEWGMCSATM